jgi:uncharacterized protein (DUF433 family)
VDGESEGAGFKFQVWNRARPLHRDDARSSKGAAALRWATPTGLTVDKIDWASHGSPMLTAEPIAHIYRDADGVAWIDRTRVKVVEVALDHVAYGWSAEEIHRQHPHLSLAQIHAALGHYYDHQAAFDQLMAEDLAEADRLAASTADSPLRRRLRLLQRPA